VSNAFFSKGRQAFALGQVNWGTGIGGDTIKAVLVDAADVTINTATMDFLDDIPLAARVATATLSGKSAVDGVLKAGNTLFTAVSGDQVEALVIYKDTGVETTSPLLIVFDTTAASAAISLIPNGGDITAVWNASGIATL
jgi:hypothetical protein